MYCTVHRRDSRFHVEIAACSRLRWKKQRANTGRSQSSVLLIVTGIDSGALYTYVTVVCPDIKNSLEIGFHTGFVNMSQLFQGCRRLWIAPSCHSIRPKPITQHDCANRGGRKWGASRLKPQSSGPIFASAALKQNESTLYSSSEDPITEFGFSRAFSERFDLGDKLGSGTFGVVRVATDKQTGERQAHLIFQCRVLNICASLIYRNCGVSKYGGQGFIGGPPTRESQVPLTALNVLFS